MQLNTYRFFLWLLHPHLSNLCMVRASVLLSSSMILLGGCRDTGSAPYCSECPPIPVWLGGPGHFWKARGEGSMLPAGMEIRSFFGGRGGDSLADMHGNFTGVPSAKGGGSSRKRNMDANSCTEKSLPVMWLGSLLKGLGGRAGGCLCNVGGLERGDSDPSAGNAAEAFVGGVGLEFWPWSGWHVPSLCIWNSKHPAVK